MNILLVSTGGHIGGEETFTKNLSLSLMSRSHNVWVAPGGQIQKEDLIKSHILIADIDIKGRNLKGLYTGAKAIRTFVREKKIEIVHCQAAGPAIMGSIVMKMNWNQGEKWIYHGHGVNEFTYKWLPLLLNMIDLSIVCSDYELINFRSNGIKESKIVRVHNGIDLNNYLFKPAEKENIRNKIRNEFCILENEYIIGYIGRLSPEKGCDLILPAILKVLEKNHEIRLLIIGDGILRKSLQKKVKLNNLVSKVIFTGFRSDIPNLLCCIDLLIMPSYKETFSLTTLQAMGAGIPVIASDTGGNPEQIITNFNGYLFERGNYIDLSLKIIKLIDNKRSHIMGTNGQELVYNYLNIERMTNEIELIYQNLN